MCNRAWQSRIADHLGYSWACAASSMSGAFSQERPALVAVCFNMLAAGLHKKLAGVAFTGAVRDRREKKKANEKKYVCRNFQLGARWQRLVTISWPLEHACLLWAACPLSFVQISQTRAAKNLASVARGRQVGQPRKHCTCPSRKQVQCEWHARHQAGQLLSAPVPLKGRSPVSPRAQANGLGPPSKRHARLSSYSLGLMTRHCPSPRNS